MNKKIENKFLFNIFSDFSQNVIFIGKTMSEICFPDILLAVRLGWCMPVRWFPCGNCALCYQKMNFFFFFVTSSFSLPWYMSSQVLFSVIIW